MCFFCEHRGRCSYHESAPQVKSEQKFTTGMRYTSLYDVLDLKTGKTSKREFRSERERDAAPVIEVAQKEATCTKCGYFMTTRNYFIKSKSGTASVNICKNCDMTRFANTKELMEYLKSKLISRYNGYDDRILDMLNG